MGVNAQVAVRGSSGVAQRADAELGDAGEVPEVACDEIEAVLEGGGGDLQVSVGQGHSAVRKRGAEAAVASRNLGVER